MKRRKIDARISELQLIIASKEKALKKAPPGHLIICKSHGNAQFYHVVQEHGTKTQKYISKESMALAVALAQKSYDADVLKAAEKELRAWLALEKLLPDLCAEEFYALLPPLRQALVTPIQPSDEEYRKVWEAVTYKPGYFCPNAPVFITNRGERVRSKSEVLIANLLYLLGIPYRYEYPLEVMVDGRRQTWRPDFTLLDVKHRREVILEHFGKLDDTSSDNYALSAFRKMRIYEENGIFEGKNMVYSYETSRAPLDMVYLEQKLRRVLGLGEKGSESAGD